MTSTQNTAWPEGVIARYVTVGGATVDVTVEVYESGYQVEATSTCTGCKDWDHDYQKRTSLQSSEDARRRAEENAREWAQSHAEKCRAMPRPQP
ncbi:hypothetical protein [Microbispora triticiradicis]|uniref:hypothetical protein n=1 Tax=Microbispora triticiradicis TaxID=2200763 RepID=UPI001AD6C621|nr:hypothetical protein [Microbispora triticiradicis]MBO4271328.1 hypothetical protein [Microbispora triticiradicis]